MQVWGSITREVATRFHTWSLEYMRTGESAISRRVPQTDGDLGSSQTYRDLVECTDDTAVMNEIRSGPERFSNHGRVEEGKIGE